MEHLIICCDWGTSSLRCRLVDRRSGQFFDGVSTDMGIAASYREWQRYGSAGSGAPLSREAFYLSLLKKEFVPLVRRNSIPPSVPVVISGMAAANIGLCEMPYTGVPFCLSGVDALTQVIRPSGDFDRAVLLISGVRDGDEVMRGEEVQVMGVSRLLPAIGEDETCIFLFPGTHSKHLRITGNRLVGIETFITGELFAVLSKEGLLRDAVGVPVPAVWGDGELTAFLRGVEDSVDGRLLHSLFKVRTNQLFGRFDQSRNTLYFSGLLIGSELRSLLTKTYDRIVLACDAKLSVYYEQALVFLGLHAATHYIDPEVVNTCTVGGQLLIANRHL